MRFSYIADLARSTGRYITIFDLETTTFRGRSNFAIMETAAVTVTPDGRAVAYGHLIDPEKPISPEAMEITGISPAMVRGKPTWTKYIKLFDEIARTHIVSGFNIATFDCPAVLEMNARYGLPIESGFAHVMDARRLYNRFTGEKKGTLVEAAARYGQSSDTGLHRAAADVALTVCLLDAMLEAHGTQEALVLAGLAKPAPKTRKGRRTAPATARSATPEAVVAALRAAQEYSFADIARALGMNERDVQFELCRAYDRGLVQTDEVAHAPTRKWLKSALFEVMSDADGPWDGKLKPLLTRLQALEQPDEVQLDYLQLRVGLEDAGLREAA